MDRPPPFEPLPADTRALRLRAVRDGLIICGWLATGFALVVVTSVGHSFGYDAFAYWSIDFNDLYGRAMYNNFALGAFRYAPPIAFLFGPFGALPWWLFLWLWEAAMLAHHLLAWWPLGARAARTAAGRARAVPRQRPPADGGGDRARLPLPVDVGIRAPDQGHARLSACCGSPSDANGARWRSRSERPRPSRSSRSSSRRTTGASGSPPALSNLYEPQFYSVPPPRRIRLPIAAVLLFWGARTDRPWTVRVAATLACRSSGRTACPSPWQRFRSCAAATAPRPCPAGSEPSACAASQSRPGVPRRRAADRPGRRPAGRGADRLGVGAALSVREPARSADPPDAEPKAHAIGATRGESRTVFSSP